MKRATFFLCLWVMMLSATQAQSLIGKILDEQQQPVPFANIVLLSLPDSAFVAGSISGEDGRFSIDNQGDLLRISSIGYTTVYRECRNGNDLGIITMRQDTHLLGEVTVKGQRPAYKLTAEGLQTSVQGTVLGKLGTAEDVLKHIPGLQKKGEAYEVFGKGSPLIYVNGRLLRDLSELDQLKSNDIRNVELITSPGARYDASVKAIVKITTQPVQGEGFGFDVRSTYDQWEKGGTVEQLNWNYRRNGLDVFGTVYYSLRNRNESTRLTQDAQTDTLWHQDNEMGSRTKSQRFTHTAGVNYAFDADNSIGAKYTLNAHPDGKSSGWVRSDVYADATLYDQLENKTDDADTYSPSHTVNVYYKGKTGETEIDFNADYLFSKTSNRTRCDEESSQHDNRLITSVNRLRNELFAAKLTASRPLWGGKLTAGAEYSHTKRQDDYINPEGYVPTAFSRLEEQNISSFVEYAHDTPVGQLSVGGRYEQVDFNYYENGKYVDGQSRTFGNFFPNLSLASALGQMQWQLGYSAKTHRPSYQQLSNNVTYGNRFTLQSGLPTLKHEVIHAVSLMGAWKFMQFSIDYTDRRNAIIYWGEQLAEQPSVTLISFKNLPSLKSVSAFVALAPRFGCWSPQLSLGMQKQWLNLATSLGIRSMSRPLFTADFQHTFSFSDGWTASVAMNWQSKGDTENLSMTRFVFYTDASLMKSFLSERLSVKLGITDLFHGMKWGNRLYLDRLSTLQVLQYDSRKASVTVRYKFNTTRSKYKGTGAANDEKQRL